MLFVNSQRRTSIKAHNQIIDGITKIKKKVVNPDSPGIPKSKIEFIISVFS